VDIAQSRTGFDSAMATVPVVAIVRMSAAQLIDDRAVASGERRSGVGAYRAAQAREEACKARDRAANTV
jgi:hypothetical protein